MFSCCFQGRILGGIVEPGVAQAATRRRVLIVDDNIDTAQGLARILTRAGHEIILAHDGVPALESAREQTPEA